MTLNLTIKNLTALTFIEMHKYFVKNFKFSLNDGISPCDLLGYRGCYAYAFINGRLK
jgi:hypothetical protein